MKLLLFAASLVIVFAERGHLASQQPAGQTGGAIIGVIQDDRGAPLANAKVTLSSGDVSVPKVTQADGKFEFRNLKAGGYRILVEAARFRKETVSVTLRPDETFAAPPIKLIPSSLHVAVLDAASQPLAGVTVSVYSKERGAVGPLAARSSSDEYGDAYFGKLAAGSYQLSASLRGYDEYRNDVFISPGITTEFPLQLQVAPVIPINEKAVTRYNIPNVPSKNVQAVFQDSEGWMWFGTDKGVTRFNGSEFKLTSLAGEDVRSIAEDDSGTIWVATSRGVRPATRSGSDVGSSFDVREPREIFVDSRGVVHVAAQDGLFEFDGKALLPSSHSSELPSSDVRALAEDKNGAIWIATAKGFAILDGDRLLSFPQAQVAGEAKSQSNRDALSDVRSIIRDSAGRMWLATSTGAYLIYKKGPGLEAVRVREGSVHAIAEDRNGRMWFALDSGGVIVYEATRRESQQAGFFDRDHVAGIFADREGHVWFATDNGVVNADFYSFVSFTTSRGLADNDVQEVVQTGNARGQKLWFLTAGGVSRLDGERFTPLEGFRSGISVQAVAFDRAGTAWFATTQGALRWTGETLTQFNEGSGLASNNVAWVSAVADGSEIVFATSRGVSVFRDGALQTLGALAGYDVRHVFEDIDGRLWFATARGILNVDRKTGESALIDSSRGLADDDARWITRFNDKLLIATHSGIQAYDGSSFTNFDAEPASTMFVDRDGFLWSGTDEGRLKKFIAFGGHVLSTVYSGEAQALTGGSINSISQDVEGNIWIATNRGAIRHAPITVTPTSRISLEVDGQPVQSAESDLYDIPFGRHRLTFRITAASSSGQTRYVYRINRDGEAKSWVLPSAQPGAEREVSLLDLDEGTHTFELISLNRDLYGARVPAATVTLRVGTPFWKSWWFYALAATIVGLAVGAAFASRRRRDREYVLPKELRNFVPIEPNPFIVGNPIRTEQMFYGREDDFRYVRTKLEGASQGVVIVFCGERRAGKSSILYQVARGRLGDKFIPVFIDLQEMVIASDSEFFARTSRLIGEALSHADDRVRSKSVAAAGAGNSAIEAVTPVRVAEISTSLRRFDRGNPYPVFLDFLDEVLGSIGERTLLILMDEYELLEGKVDEGKLSNEFFTFLAGLMDNKERLALIFTGSRRLEERDRKYWRELLRRSLFRKVGFLSENDTQRLITEPVQGRVVYGRGVIAAIYRLTAGQPFYTQVICQNVVDYMNEHRQNWVTKADLNNVIAEIVDNPLPQMIYTWDALSDDEKLALSLLAEALPDGLTFSTARELRVSVRTNDYPVNLSENTIRLTLEEMFRRELLDKDTAGAYRFKIDLLRLWIRRSHSIWQVVKEVRTL